MSTVEETMPEFDDALIAQGEILLQQGINDGATDTGAAQYAQACFFDSIARSLNAIQGILEQQFAVPEPEPKKLGAEGS